MKYCLKMDVLEPVPVIEINKNEFDSLAYARKTLVDANAFEQRFEMALENYRVFELAAANWSLSSVIESQHSYSYFARVLADANRHIVNFLSTVRLYLDQTAGSFAHLTVEPPFKCFVGERRSKAYDSSASYRFMEALRNHVQHRSTPVHRLGGRPITQDRNEWAETFTLWTTKELLLEQGGFKAAVLAEMPSDVDLRDAARDYISSLSAIHADLRIQLAEVVEAGRAEVQGAIDRYAREYGDKVVALHALDMDGNTVLSSVPLLLDWDDERKELAAKNRWPFSVRTEQN